MAENYSQNSRWSQNGFNNRGDSGRQRGEKNIDNRGVNHVRQRDNEQRTEQRGANRSSPIMPDYVRPLRNFTSPTHQQAPVHQPAPTHQQAPVHQPAPTHQQASVRQPASTHQPTKSGLGGFLDKLNLKNFDLDGDRALIIMMMALLQKESFDETLMLALLYIML